MEVLNLDATTGLVILRDAEQTLPAGARSDLERRALRQLAADGSVFYLDAEDQLEARITTAIGVSPPDLPEHRFERVGGAFHLRVASGQLAIGEDIIFDVEPGDQRVTVYQHTILDRDRYQSERRALLSTEDWRFRTLIERCAQLGCLPFLVAWILVFIRGFDRVSMLALAIGILALAPSYILMRTRRYRDTETRLRAMDKDRPNYAFHIQHVDDATNLVGGHLII